MMGYLIIEHVESGQGSRQEIHEFKTEDAAHQYIRDCRKARRNLLECLTLYEVNEIKLDEKNYV